MTKDFKKFLTESELKLEPTMRVGDTLRLNINAKQIVEMTITDIGNDKITVESSRPDYLDFDKDGDEEESMKKALKDKDDHTVDEGQNNDAELQDIVSSMSNDVAEFYSGAEMSSDLYEKLYDYYSQEMPYGTQKARDGDPMNWISDRFLQDLDGMNYGAQDSKLDEILQLSGVKAIAKEDTVDEGFKVGDKVRVTKPSATPSYEVLGKNATHYQLRHRNNGSIMNMPKERIHRVNQIGGNKYIRPNDSETNLWKVDEAMSPQQKFDFQRVTYGAMKKADYDAKWKKPVDGSKKLDPTGVYKNLIKKPVDESSKPDYLDFDKDGDEEESMKKALNDKEEKVDEAMSPQQRFDFQRVMYGAMKRSDYDKKWVKPNDGTEKLDPTGVYKNLIKKPVDESSKPDYLDFDKDGDEEESMKKALKDKEEDKDDVDESLDDILKLSGVKPITREAPGVSEPVAESRGNIFATILKNAGVKAVTESDLNNKTNEGFGKSIKRAFRGWPEPEGIHGEANKPKDIVARVRSADDEFLNDMS